MYEGPSRCSSQSSTRKPGYPATAASSMRRRSATEATVDARCGGRRLGNEPDLGEAKAGQQFPGRAQVAYMYRVESAAKQSDWRGRCCHQVSSADGSGLPLSASVSSSNAFQGSPRRAPLTIWSASPAMLSRRRSVAGVRPRKACT